ncbi:MAG: DNA repair photolyase, partial [Parasphingorhabdus sp.]
MSNSEGFVPKPPAILKGRGTDSSIVNRFQQLHGEWIDDGWDLPEQEATVRTELIRDHSRSVLTRNQSPDVPFDRSINPYRGCEHGCIYCYARPTHAWLDMSPGLDFETRILYKQDAAEILREQLGKKNYQCQPIGIGTNTDAWQPAERQLGISRRILEVLLEFNHPVRIVTKSTGILR